MIQLAVEMTVVVNDHRLRLGVDPRKTEKLQGSYLGGVLVVQVKVWPHRLCLTTVHTAGLHLVTYRKGARPVCNSRIGDGAAYKESPDRFVLPGKYAKLGVYDHTVTISVQSGIPILDPGCLPVYTQPPSFDPATGSAVKPLLNVPCLNSLEMSFCLVLNLSFPSEAGFYPVYPFHWSRRLRRIFTARLERRAQAQTPPLTRLGPLFLGQALTKIAAH